MSFEIRILDSLEEKQQVFKLRYEIYCDELHCKPLENEQHLLTDRFDETAYIFAAYQSGELVGTMRVNLAVDSELPFETENNVRQLAQRFYPAHVSSATKFAVKPKYRSSVLAFKMTAASYCFGLSKNILYDFIDINNPNLIDFYLRLGYKKYTDRKFTNQYGEFQPMVLEPFNEKYLREIKSPLAGLLQNYLSVNNISAHIYEKIYQKNSMNGQSSYEKAM
jgi:predicted GNAT family N-acyltransferase